MSTENRSTGNRPVHSAAYERARRRRIMEARRRKRRLRKIVKTAIISGMALIAFLICLGVGFGVRAIVRKFGTSSISESVLAQRSEAMPDLSTITIPKEEVPDLDFTVCIDPGHGGIDPGTNQGKRTEKDDVLKLSLAIEKELKALGAKVVMTRDDDTFLTLSARAVVANDAGVDFFLSVHRNGAENAVTQGVDIYAKSPNREYSEESMKYAEAIIEAIDKVGVSNSRGAHFGSNTAGDWQVNRETGMPSCLLEMGFLTNDEDNEYYDDNLEDYAKAIAKAIVSVGVNDGSKKTPVKGIVLSNKKIKDVNAINSEAITWAPGTETDENNLPKGAVEFQEKYGAYQAQFLFNDVRDEVFLTFDEGYEPGYTEKILDVLKERGVSAVFFVTLPFVQSNEELVQRMIREGHIIGNHSAYNESKGIVDKSLEDQKDSIQELDEYMLEKFNYRMCLFRFPNGVFSEQSLAMVNNLDYQSVFWSFSYGDYDDSNQPDEKEALKVMTKYLHNGAIYLLSARSKTNARVLDDFITQVNEEGYSFGTYTVKSTADAQEDDAPATDVPEDVDATKAPH